MKKTEEEAASYKVILCENSMFSFLCGENPHTNFLIKKAPFTGAF